LGGDTLQTFTVTKNGSYAVVIEKGTCIDTSLCADVNGLGINNHSMGNSKVYPLPTTGKLYIDMGMELDVVKMDLMNLQGQVVLNRTFVNIRNAELDLNIPKGTYILYLKNKSDISVFRIVKE